MIDQIRPDAGQHAWDLLARLFPIHRTLVNDGFLRSLEIINEHVPLEILEYPSGLRVWDWIIPNAWDVREAWIADSNGRRIVDFANSNLHLAAYSVAFEGNVSREEMMNHLCWLDQLPDAIPFSYKYYKPDWQFCIAKNDLARFTDSEYHVRIDVDARPDKLRVGQCVLPGETDEVIVISTYMCHPSLANDSLSGVVSGVEIFRHLASLPRRHYTYRLLIAPETVGIVAWLSRNEELIPRIAGGYVLTCCGDPGATTYKKSFKGDAMVDRAAIHFLRHGNGGRPYEVRGFRPEGSDERQFNAPGVRRPFGVLMRTPFAEFPEYHNSRDGLSFVRPEYLHDTLRVLAGTLQIVDNNACYRNQYKGEPFLTRHGIHVPFETVDDDGYINCIIGCESDGTQDLLAIAEKHGRPFHKILEFNRRFEEAGLVKRV